IAAKKSNGRSYRPTKTRRTRIAMDAAKSVSGKTFGQSAIEYQRFRERHASFRDRSYELGIKFRAGRFRGGISDERSEPGQSDPARDPRNGGGAGNGRKNTKAVSRSLAQRLLDHSAHAKVPKSNRRTRFGRADVERIAPRRSQRRPPKLPLGRRGDRFL